MKVSVTQAPEKGKANKALRKQLVESLDLRTSQVELVSGETTTRKTFLIRDVSLEDLQFKIDRLMK